MKTAVHLARRVLFAPLNACNALGVPVPKPVLLAFIAVDRPLIRFLLQR